LAKFTSTLNFFSHVVESPPQMTCFSLARRSHQQGLFFQTVPDPPPLRTVLHPRLIFPRHQSPGGNVFLGSHSLFFRTFVIPRFFPLNGSSNRDSSFFLESLETPPLAEFFTLLSFQWFPRSPQFTTLETPHGESFFPPHGTNWRGPY